jgi:hypothetical protein
LKTIVPTAVGAEPANVDDAEIVVPAATGPAVGVVDSVGVKAGSDAATPALKRAAIDSNTTRAAAKPPPGRRRHRRIITTPERQ